VASLSRPMRGLVSETHERQAARVRALLARRQEKQDMIDLGAYVAGRDALLDEAIRRGPALESLVRQGVDERVSFDAAAAALAAVFGDAP